MKSYCCLSVASSRARPAPFTNENILLVSVAKKAVTVPIEPLLVTWVNHDYNKTGKSWPKIIFRPDGTWATFGHTDITEGLEGPFTIIDSWIDSDGNKYFKCLNQVWGKILLNTGSNPL